MPLSERIVVNPEILGGKPVIRGTRLPVEFLLELVDAGESEEEILISYPGLEPEDILFLTGRASARVPARHVETCATSLVSRLRSFRRTSAR